MSLLLISLLVLAMFAGTFVLAALGAAFALCAVTAWLAQSHKFVLPAAGRHCRKQPSWLQVQAEAIILGAARALFRLVQQIKEVRNRIVSWWLYDEPCLTGNNARFLERMITAPSTARPVTFGLAEAAAA